MIASTPHRQELQKEKEIAIKHNHLSRVSVLMAAAILFAACSLVVLTVGEALADTDTTPPDTTITSGPSGLTGETTPTFSLGGTDDVNQADKLQYSYKVDYDVYPWRVHGEWSAFSSDTNVTLGGTSGLMQGSYTFYVRAKDEAGNVDTTPAQQSFQVDIPPAPPRINTPTDNYLEDDSNLLFVGGASEFGSVDLFEGQNKVATATIGAGDCPAGCIYGWHVWLTGVPNGTHTYYAIATDQTGNVSAPSNSVTVVVDDTTPPHVASTNPAADAAGISPTANVKATFSEAMMCSTINGTTFELFEKGSTTKVGASVSYNATTQRGILDTTDSLKSGVTYRAVVRTGAEDLSGNQLDQDATLSGNQPKRWFFTVGN